MRYLTGSIAASAVCGLTFVGCVKDEPAPAKPTTMISASGATTKPAVTVSTTLPAAATAAAEPMMADKDMTHEVTAETPMFTTMPVAAGAEPAMTLKAGDKVLVMIPRGKYAQVTTIGGVKGYVTTASLKPIGG
jgi:hypothetical protein